MRRLFDGTNVHAQLLQQLSIALSHMKTLQAIYSLSLDVQMALKVQSDNFHKIFHVLLRRKH